MHCIILKGRRQAGVELRLGYQRWTFRNFCPQTDAVFGISLHTIVPSSSTVSLTESPAYQAEDTHICKSYLKILNQY